MKTHWAFWLRYMIPSVISVFFGTVGPAAANILHVANNGVDSSSCGWETPCRSISQAIANAASGDTIYVGPGRYGDVSGDSNFTGPGDEQPDLNAGGFILDQQVPRVPEGCMVCISKPLHIYSLQGAATTVIASVPTAPYGSTVMIETDGVDFGSVGHGFTISGGTNNGVTIVMPGFPVLHDMSVQGNIDLGDANGFAFYGYPLSLRTVPCGQEVFGQKGADCRFTARVLVANNQAINNQTGVKVIVNYCCQFGGGHIFVIDNLALGAGTGFAVIPDGAVGSMGPDFSASNVQLLNNVASGGVVGFSASLGGAIENNSALNNSQAGFELVPGGAAFYGNSAIGNGGPGVIINYVVMQPPYYFPQVTLNTFVPFWGNNFIGNDRKRPVGPSAHCGVLSGIFLPAEGRPIYPPPPPIQLAAAGNYWGSSTGPSPTGPADAVGGACAQNNTTTIAMPFSKTPFQVRSVP